jgi:hypothetical protein
VNDVVRERIAKGGKLYLVIVPADAAVAATYFGANESANEMSPRLTLEATLARKWWCQAQARDYCLGGLTAVSVPRVFTTTETSALDAASFLLLNSKATARSIAH